MGNNDRISNAAIEIRVSVFCAVIAGLALVYRMVEPDIGNIVFRLSLLTFCLSLAFSIYKMIFGNLGGFFVVMFFIFMYVAAIGNTFGMQELVRWGVLLGLLVIAIKAFIIIFGSKSSRGEKDYIKCKHCGHLMDNDSMFCENCGAKLE